MIQKAKGTYDIYGEYGKKLLYVRELIEGLMEKYNYEYIQTPIFESSSLFHRSVGETSDIVTKETYDFKDRKDRPLTLRPEGTAGIVRSFIENKMYAKSMPVKVWYQGSMFRYERPQTGRNREFTQFGLEVFGTSDPMADAEVISIAVNLFKLLGLKGIKVNINSLGDTESRENYRNALIKYFEPYIDELCSDCKERFKKNPLRILDCKVDAQKDIMKNAPKTIDYLNEESKEHFSKVQKYLSSIGIDFVVNTNIVRGLDYYTHTVFEVEADVEGFGAQNVLGAGGRYNNLVKALDGPDTCGVGFALGMERLMLALDYEKINLPIINNIDCYVIPMDDTVKDYAYNIVTNLRLNGFITDTDYNSKKLQNNFKSADRMNAKFIIIIGEEEKNSGILTIKNNETKEEFKVKFDDVIDFLDENLL